MRNKLIFSEFMHTILVKKKGSEIMTDSQIINENAFNEDLCNDGCFVIKKNDKLICCLVIIGQIEGHYKLSEEIKTTQYENIIPKLVSVEEDDNISGLLLIINTVGGDIEAGMAISELVAGMRKKTASLVLGGGHSIGISLAVSAKKSFIVPSATMTVHPVRMNGLIMGVPQQLEYFNDMQERIIGFVSGHSKISEDRFRELMMSSGNLVADFGTVLSGEEAVKEGIIDSIGSVDDAISVFFE